MAYKRRNTGELINDLEEELNHQIDLFLEEAKTKKRSLDDIVILFKPVQQELNKLTEQASWLKGKVEEIGDELEDLQEEFDKESSTFDQSVELKGCKIRITAGGKLSLHNQDTLEKILEAIGKDEILCNQNVNAFL